MNNGRSSEFEQHKSLQILNELSVNYSLTQRDLSGRLDIALGLVNSYLKNLISKGFITVKSIPPRRYAYFLTPKGFAEKTRLSYEMLRDYTRIYREARSGFKDLFSELRNDGIKHVTFAGADEVAEIAYITLHEMDLELAGVLDDELAGKKFFGRDIKKICEITAMNSDCVVVTSYLKREKIYIDLLGNKTPKENIKSIFSVSIVNSK
jgi:DNA-binding MarR family transcriptional regulator